MLLNLLFVLLVPQPATDARSVAEQYVAAALSGKTDDAVKLAVEGQSTAKPKKIEELKEAIGKDKLLLPTVYFSDAKKYALAVSDSVKVNDPKGAQEGVLVFVLVKRDDGWRVKDIDFRDAAKAKKLVEDMQKLMPDAMELKPKKLV
jgi:hypothetical protein